MPAKPPSGSLSHQLQFVVLQYNKSVRVLRTFAFLDLSGFTHYNAQQGDDQATLVLSQLRNAVRNAAERRGVRLAKWLGDGAMLSGLEPATVIACALEAQYNLSKECPLPLRAGICRGKVIMFEGDDYVGVAVNQASRLCDEARSGEILIAGVDEDVLPWWTSSRHLRYLDPQQLGEGVEVLAVSLAAAVSQSPAYDPICGLPLLSQDPKNGKPLFCSASCRAHWEDEQRSQRED